MIAIEICAAAPQGKLLDAGSATQAGFLKRRGGRLPVSDGLQIRNQRIIRGVPIGRGFRHHFQNHGLHGGRNRGVDVRRISRLFLDVFFEQHMRVDPEKREPPGRHVIKTHPQRIHIGAEIDALAKGLFRRNVIGRAANVPRTRLGIGFDGQPKIEDFDDPIHVNHYVVELDVPVDHPERIGVPKSHGCALDDPRRQPGRKHLGVCAQHPAQISPANVFHRDEINAGVHSNVEHPHDIFVLQFHRRSAFAGKLSDEMRLLGKRWIEDFEGVNFLGLQMPSGNYPTHPPVPDFLD